jgi:1-acyl-sn-glycerol-3-phosphate acyltransferase
MIWLRSAAFQAYFHVMTTLLLLVAGLPALLLPPRFSLRLARFWARAVLGGLRVICGVKLEVLRADLLPPGPCVIASRHESAFDTFVWLTLRPCCAYVVKAELAAAPVLGALIRRAGMIVVDRTGGAQALRGLLRDGAAAAAAGRTVVIFPEGTRMAPGSVAAIQPGVAALAAALRLPVAPVATDSGERWGRRAFRIVPGVVRVAVRPVLPAGTGRVALTAGIAAGIQWAPVDKSVGAKPRDFENSASVVP